MAELRNDGVAGCLRHREAAVTADTRSAVDPKRMRPDYGS